jgi:transcriptional regulator with XRE-family HTH domain
VVPSYISRIERGERKGTREKIMPILAVLKIKPGEAFGDEYQTQHRAPKYDDILKELSAVLPATIKVYDRISDKQEASYEYVPKEL